MVMETVMVKTDGDINGEGDNLMRQGPLSLAVTQPRCYHYSKL